MSRLGTITRRTLLVGAAAIAGGAAFGVYSWRKPYPNPLEGELDPGEATFNPWLKIGADNAITIIVPRAEMGQGVTTTLAALVAEELDVTLDQVTVEHGPASFAYYNEAMADAGPFPFWEDGLVARSMETGMRVVSKMLGLQGTGGSTSTRDAFDRMRMAGAVAREMLKEAAAARLQASLAGLSTAAGRVTEASSGRSLSYGELAADAAKLEPRTVALRDPKDWTLLGKPQRRTDLLPKITGQPVFGIDTRLPDMLHGTVRMSPRFGAGARSANLDAARAMPGVVAVVPLSTPYGHGFGVIADTTWTAFRAAASIEVEWEDAAYPGDDDAIERRLAETLDRRDGGSLRDDGDVERAFADAPADRVIEAEYAVPYLAHATMEPMNATAWLRDGRLDIWCGNQAPTFVRSFCAEAAGLAEEAVEVHTPMLGGGFGRRAEIDAALYATHLAREAGGRPVKVTWSREEDITHDVYRPVAAGRFRARLGDDGLPVALDMNIAAPSPLRSILGRLFPSFTPAGPDRLLTEGAFDQPYTIPDYRVTGTDADLAIPTGFWRSVGNSYNAFFHECFIDEIAAKGGIDPVALRLKLMADHPVAVKLVERVAEMSGWEKPAGPGRARGIAFCISFGTWVAEVVEIADTGAGIRIEKVWCAADLGTVLDPDIVRAQMMSAIVFGLSQSLGQQITFADGMVRQSNFHDFDAMRINQCPAIEVELLATSPRMGGAGEPGTPPAAAALANAVFALTGKRIRRLPLSEEADFA